MKDIINTNKIFQYHGYQEWYRDKKKITHRGNWRNNKMIGYVEWYGIKETNFHIK
jgi:hypothetical protein